MNCRCTVVYMSFTLYMARNQNWAGFTSMPSSQCPGRILELEDEVGKVAQGNLEDLPKLGLDMVSGFDCRKASKSRVGQAPSRDRPTLSPSACKGVRKLPCWSSFPPVQNAILPYSSVSVRVWRRSASRCNLRAQLVSRSAIP